MGCVESSNEPPQQQARASVKQPVRNGSNQTRQKTAGAPQNGSSTRSSGVQNGTAVPRKVTMDVGMQTEGGGFILRRLSSRIKQKRSTREQRVADPPVDDSMLFDLHRTVTLNQSNVSLYIEQALTLPEKQGGMVRRASSKSRKTEPDVSRYIDQALSMPGKQGVARRSSSKSKKVSPVVVTTTTSAPREEAKPVDEGPLSKKDIRLVQECWKHVQKDLAAFGVELFVRLLDQNPSMSNLFPFGKLNLTPEQLQNNPDLRAHGQRVMGTIGTAVEGLEDLELIVAILQDLGERHSMYGAKPEHFSAVAEAFMYSLRNGLPPKVFSSEVQAAYGNVLTIVAETMSSTMGSDRDKTEPNEKDLNANEEGPISAQDKKLVQGCWNIIQNDLVNIGAVFFVRLLEQNPSIRTLFPFGKSPLPPQMLKRNPDLRAHGQNVMEVIGAAVRGLDELDVVVTILEELGGRHRMYGAKPEHFKPVVESLMFALTTSLPKDVFTSEAQEAWLSVLKVVGSVMADQLE